MTHDPRQIIRAHRTTERTTDLRTKNNEYVFEVERTASKHAIREAIESAFKVKVAEVRTMRVPGKRRRMGRNEGTTPIWKKAIVKLKDGEVISMFEI